MKTLIIGDSHIEEKYIDELKATFAEIMSYSADECIHLGDYYNHNKLTPKEIAFGTYTAMALQLKFKKLTILSGNGQHDWFHEESIIKYLNNVSIEVPGMELEKTIDGKKCFFGHYMTNESYKEYGSHEYTVADLMKYDIVLLGHQHNPQEIRKNKMYHVGSMIYQHANEAKDDHKQIAMIEDGVLKFIPLKTPISMKDVNSLEELKTIDKNTKVRLIFSSFAQFKREIPYVKDWNKKFVEFKTKLDFDKNVATDVQIDSKVNKGKSLQAIVEEELTKIEDEEVRSLLMSQFKEDNSEKVS